MAFVPKLLAMVLALGISLPWILTRLVEYSHDLIANIPELDVAHSARLTLIADNLTNSALTLSPCRRSKASSSLASRSSRSCSRASAAWSITAPLFAILGLPRQVKAFLAVAMALRRHARLHQHAHPADHRPRHLRPHARQRSARRPPARPRHQ